MALKRNTAERRASTIDPYWAVAAALLVLLVIQTANRRWSTDFWLHKATLDTFRRDLIHPAQPLTGTRDAFEYYSPYTFILAATARVTGWSSILVLQCAAILNLGLFLVGFRLLVQQLTNRLATTFALVATLFFWGWNPWRWSGYLNFNSIGFGLPYPSMFATGLALVVAWALLRYDDTRDRRWLLVVAFGLPAVMLSHAFTGVWTAILLIALAVHRKMYRRATAAPLAVALVAVAVLLAVWPYYPYFRLLGGEEHNEPPALYAGIPWRLCAALPGLVALLRRFRRDRTDPLVLTFVGAGLVYGIGAVTKDYNLGRMLPLVVLPLHIGIGELVASFFQRDERTHPALVGWVVASGLVGVAGVSTALSSMIPHALLPGSLKERRALKPITDQYRALNRTLPSGGLVVVERPVMEEIVAGRGLYPLSVDWAGAFVGDAAQRNNASREILAPATSQEHRTELVQRYHVVGALCDTGRCSRLFAGPRSRVEDFTLTRLSRP